MGKSTSWLELSGKLDKAAANLQKSTPKTVRLAAEMAQRELDAEIRKAVPDMDMSSLSKPRKGGKARSGKVGTKVVRAHKYATDGSALAVKAVGAVHWFESGTRPHLVGAGRVGRYKTTRSQYRKAAGKFMLASGATHPVRGPLAHPGTRARHTWSKGIRRAAPAAAEKFAQRAVIDIVEPFT